MFTSWQQRIRQKAQRVAGQLKMIGVHLPANQRQRVLDAIEEPMPQEYQNAVRRYFQQLSEAQ